MKSKAFRVFDSEQIVGYVNKDMAHAVSNFIFTHMEKSKPISKVLAFAHEIQNRANLIPRQERTEDNVEEIVTEKPFEVFAADLVVYRLRPADAHAISDFIMSNMVKGDPNNNTAILAMAHQLKNEANESDNTPETNSTATNADTETPTTAA